MKSLYVVALSLILLGCAAPLKNGGKSSAIDLKSVVNDIVNSALEVDNKRVMRVGVISFTPTQSQLKKDNAFGEYFTERLLTGLSLHKKSFKLFERSRLDAILSEAALSLSGIIDEKSAMKIGELAPIDYIITGTYTKLSNSVEVNGRLTDVVSGEILISFDYSVNINGELAGLFPQVQQANAKSGTTNNTTTIVQEKTKSDICKEADEEIKRVLTDLTTDEKVNAVVDAAIKHPFGLECGAFHFNVINSFWDHEKQSPKYGNFLIEQLASIDKPSADRRAGMIMGYFLVDSVVNDKEWAAGLEAITKSSPTYIRSYISTLFRLNPKTAAQLDQQKARVKQLVDLAQSGKVGRPVAGEFKVISKQIFQGLRKTFRANDNRMFFWYFDTYVHATSNSDVKSNHSQLLYLYERKDHNRQEALKRICINLQKAKPDPDIAYEIFSFIIQRDYEIRQKSLPASERKIAADDIHYFVENCRGIIESSMATTNRDLDNRIELALKYNINSPAVPKLNSLIAGLFSADMNQQGLAAKYLKLMGANAKEAEKAVLKIVRKKDRLEGRDNLIGDCLITLANINTKDPQAHKLILECSKANRKYREAAKQAISIMPKPFIKPLIREVNSQNRHISMSAINTLAYMKSNAKPAAPTLKSLLKKSKNNQIKGACEDALDQILGFDWSL